MYCRCGNRGYCAALHDPPKHKYDFNQDFWVCSRCNKPARMYFERTIMGYVPRGATSILSSIGDGAGRTMLRWGTAVSGERIETMQFRPYPRKQNMPHDQGRSILLDLWTKLDSYIDTIRNPDTLPDSNLTFYQPRASELADVLAVLMAPFYENGQAVLIESMARWTARQNGTVHDTPGLAEEIWENTFQVLGTNIKRDAVPAAPPTPETLDTAKQTFIKTQIDNGSFGAKELAGMFGVSEDVIRHNYDLANA